jgi:hypothetical protein
MEPFDLISSDKLCWRKKTFFFSFVRSHWFINRWSAGKKLSFFHLSLEKRPLNVSLLMRFCRCSSDSMVPLLNRYRSISWYSLDSSFLENPAAEPVLSFSGVIARCYCVLHAFKGSIPTAISANIDRLSHLVADLSRSSSLLLLSPSGEYLLVFIVQNSGSFGDKNATLDKPVFIRPEQTNSLHTLSTSTVETVSSSTC